MSKSFKDPGLFPVAQPIPTTDFTPDPEGPELPPGLPGGIPGLPGLPGPIPSPWPFPHFCGLSLPQGCYQLNISTEYSGSRFPFSKFQIRLVESREEWYRLRNKRRYVPLFFL
jgi:hypothetical protein